MYSHEFMSIDQVKFPPESSSSLSSLVLNKLLDRFTISSLDHVKQLNLDVHMTCGFQVNLGNYFKQVN